MSRTRTYFSGVKYRLTKQVESISNHYKHASGNKKTTIIGNAEFLSGMRKNDRLIANNPERFSEVNNDIVRAINFYTKCAIPVNELEENTNMCYAWESSIAEARGKGKIEGKIEGKPREKKILSIYIHG